MWVFEVKQFIWKIKLGRATVSRQQTRSIAIYQFMLSFFLNILSKQLSVMRVEVSSWSWNWQSCIKAKDLVLSTPYLVVGVTSTVFFLLWLYFLFPISSKFYLSLSTPVLGKAWSSGRKSKKNQSIINYWYSKGGHLAACILLVKFIFPLNLPLISPQYNSNLTK